MAKQIAKMLQNQEIAEINRVRAQQEAGARKVLADALEHAKHEQTEALEQGLRLVNVKEVSDKAKGSFLGSMIAVFRDAKANKIPMFAAKSLLEAELGNEDSLGDSKAANTVKTHRSSAINFGFVMYDPDFEKYASVAAVNLKREDGSERNLESLTVKEVRAVITAYTNEPEKAQFDSLVKQLTKKIRDAVRGRSENKEEGLVALDAIPFKDMNGWLSKMLLQVPERPVSSSKGVQDSTPNAETLSAALEASDESNHATDADDTENGAQRVA